MDDLIVTQLVEEILPVRDAAFTSRNSRMQNLHDSPRVLSLASQFLLGPATVNVLVWPYRELILDGATTWTI